MGETQQTVMHENQTQNPCGGERQVQKYPYISPFNPISDHVLFFNFEIRFLVSVSFTFVTFIFSIVTGKQVITLKEATHGLKWETIC